MRKTILAIAAIAAMSTPALAESITVYGNQNPAAPAEVAGGAVAGTVAGVAVSEGWIGGSLGAALPVTTAGAATVGGVVGVGTIAGIDSVIQPCRGYQALFGLNQAACAQRQAMLNR